MMKEMADTTFGSNVRRRMGSGRNLGPIVGDARIASGLLLAIGIVACCGYMVFVNNDSIALITAQYIDSGSLLSNYHAMINSADFNQNNQYHTSVYGWPGNSLILWTIYILGVNSVVHQAEIARAASLLFSSLSVAAIGGLLFINRADRVLSVICLLVLATWPPFLSFSYQIHPEGFGLFLSTASLFAATVYVRRGERYGWLYLSWALAVSAVLSKQPFMVYLLPPLMAGFHTLSRSPKRTRFFITTFVAFVIVGAVVSFISNPYIFLDFHNFLQKQIYMRTVHSGMSKSLLTSVKNWSGIILYQEPWFALGILASVIAIFCSKDLIVVAAAWSNLLFLFVLIVFLRFFFFSSYLYPALPATVLVISTLPSYLRLARIPLVTLVFVLAALLYSGINTIRSAGAIISAANFSETGNVVIANALKGIDAANMTIVYSTSLPVPTTNFKNAFNNFQFSKAPN